MIGTFGPLVFVASEKKIRTFDNFQRSSSARWAVHDIHLAQPKPEYLGPGQDQITFSIRFDVRYGMKPRNELSRLTKYCNEGRIERLIIGGVPIGAKSWYISAISQQWTSLDNRGKLLVGGADITLQEYV
ncbi:phage tail protein [Paenibacillaceae bacterium]|nr:phage tail protein [Paenibacillaceae bacterium]